MGRRKIVFKGRVFEVASERVLLPSGRRVRRDTVRHPGSVAVLALNDRAQVLLLRQFRYAVGRVIWEIPAGTLEPGERPLACARRELAEETGYRAGRWRKLTTIYPSPGILDERLHLYVAWELRGGASRTEPDEDITCRWLPVRRALAMVRSGSIGDAKSICALLYAVQFGVPDVPFGGTGVQTGSKQ